MSVIIFNVDNYVKTRSHNKQWVQFDSLINI